MCKPRAGQRLVPLFSSLALSYLLFSLSFSQLSAFYCFTFFCSDTTASKSPAHVCLFFQTSLCSSHPFFCLGRNMFFCLFKGTIRRFRCNLLGLKLKIKINKKMFIQKLDFLSTYLGQNVWMLRIFWTDWQCDWQVISTRVCWWSK